jgi:hypothetical protein
MGRSTAVVEEVISSLYLRKGQIFLEARGGDYPMYYCLK